MLHWASLILFFALGVFALWVANTFLKRNGLYFFCIVASIAAAYFSKVQLFYKIFSVQMVVMPVIFLALLLCYFKYGKKESIRLFSVVLISQVSMFVIRFFEFAFLDLFNVTRDYLEWDYLNRIDYISNFLSWSYLNSFIATIIAFALSCVAGYFFVEYVKMQKVHRILRTAIYVGLVSIVDSLLFIIIAYSGYFSFVDILLTFLLYIAFNVIMALILGCYELLLNKDVDGENKDTQIKTSKTNSANSSTNNTYTKLGDGKKTALDSSSKQVSTTKTIGASKLTTATKSNSTVKPLTSSKTSLNSSSSSTKSLTNSKSSLNNSKSKK